MRAVRSSGTALFGGAHETVADHPADRRQQQQQTRHVGDQAGHEQQHTARGDQQPSVSSACGTRRWVAASAMACAARTPSRRASHMLDQRAGQQHEQRPPEPDRGPESDQRNDLDHEVQEDERHTLQRRAAESFRCHRRPMVTTCST